MSCMTFYANHHFIGARMPSEPLTAPHLPHLHHLHHLHHLPALDFWVFRMMKGIQ